MKSHDRYRQILLSELTLNWSLKFEPLIATNITQTYTSYNFVTEIDQIVTISSYIRARALTY
jgi:hypothetical protein